MNNSLSIIIKNLYFLHYYLLLIYILYLYFQIEKLENFLQ